MSNNDNCGICLNDLGKYTWQCAKCKQKVIHASCIIDWLETSYSCPLCRGDMDDSCFLINNCSEEDQIKIVNKFPGAIINIKKVAKALLLAIIKLNVRAVRYIDELSEELQWLVVEKSWYNFRYIKNSSDVIKLAAVKNDGCLIKHISEPSKEMILTALAQNEYAAKYIEDSPSKYKKYIPIYGTASYTVENIEFFKILEDKYFIWCNPRCVIKEYLEVVRKDGNNIKHLLNPPVEVQVAAMQNSDAFKDIDELSYELKLAAIKQDPYLIRQLSYPSEEIQMIAVKQNPSVIRYIDIPSMHIQMIAVEQDPSTIKYIRNPCERVRVAAIHSIKVSSKKKEPNYLL